MSRFSRKFLCSQDLTAIFAVPPKNAYLQKPMYFPEPLTEQTARRSFSFQRSQAAQPPRRRKKHHTTNVPSVIHIFTHTRSRKNPNIFIPDPKSHSHNFENHWLPLKFCKVLVHFWSQLDSRAFEASKKILVCTWPAQEIPEVRGN